MDVKNAFLQGELEEQIYMVQPLRFQSGLSTSVVCRLKKSLYGLKPAPRAWNANIMKRLHRIKFATSKSNSSLFIQQGRHGPVSILLNVDDLVIASTDPKDIGHVKSQLATSWAGSSEEVGSQIGQRPIG